MADQLLPMTSSECRSLLEAELEKEEWAFRGEETPLWNQEKAKAWRQQLLTASLHLNELWSLDPWQQQRIRQDGVRHLIGCAQSSPNI